jgi:hypothetical protein
MTCERALEQWGTKISYREGTRQFGLLRNSSQTGGPKAPYIIHGPLGPTFYPIDKTNITADGFEHQFTLNELCDHEHKQQVEARVHTLLDTADEDTPVNFRPSEISKEI